MLRGYEYFAHQEGIRASTRNNILSQTQSDSSYNDYQKIKRICKTVWMLYAIFVVLCLIAALIVSKYDKTKFSTAFLTCFIVNVVCVISVLCVTKLLINKKKKIYLDEYAKKCNESGIIERETNKLAQIAMLSYTLSIHDDINDEDDLIKRTNEEIKKLQKENGDNLTAEDLINFYSNFVNRR